MAAHQGGLFEIGNADQPRGEAVLHVVRAVGDLVADVRDLRLERGEAEAAQILGNEARPAGVGEDAVPGLAGQVQAGKVGIGAFQRVHDPEGLDVVLEAAVVAHQPVQHVLARVAEGGVPEIVGERHRFGEVLVEAERAGDRPRDLRDLKGMREPGAVVVALVVDEDLGLVLEPAEGARMDDAVPVPLIRRPEPVGRFRPAASRAARAVGGGSP